MRFRSGRAEPLPAVAGQAITPIPQIDAVALKAVGRRIDPAMATASHKLNQRLTWPFAEQSQRRSPAP
jgi:hypothetical protein